MSPYLLLQNNIPVVRCTQFPGEFIINFPGMRSVVRTAHHLLQCYEFACEAKFETGYIAGSACRGIPLRLQPWLQLR